MPKNWAALPRMGGRPPLPGYFSCMDAGVHCWLISCSMLTDFLAVCFVFWARLKLQVVLLRNVSKVIVSEVCRFYFIDIESILWIFYSSSHSFFLQTWRFSTRESCATFGQLSRWGEQTSIMNEISSDFFVERRRLRSLSLFDSTRVSFVNRLQQLTFFIIQSLGFSFRETCQTIGQRSRGGGPTPFARVFLVYGCRTACWLISCLVSTDFWLCAVFFGKT